MMAGNGVVDGLAGGGMLTASDDGVVACAPPASPPALGTLTEPGGESAGGTGDLPV